MLLDDGGVLGQLDYFGVVQRIAIAQLDRHVDGLDRTAGLGLAGEFHLDQFGADIAADHGRLAHFQHRLVDIEFVRIDRALHHRFAQAIARGDEHHVLEAGFGIERKHHSGRAEVGSHHALHAGRQRDIGVGEALVDAVGNRAVVIQRGKHLFYCMKNIL